jgi:hypothetical protein
LSAIICAIGSPQEYQLRSETATMRKRPTSSGAIISVPVIHLSRFLLRPPEYHDDHLSSNGFVHFRRRFRPYLESEEKVFGEISHNICDFDPTLRQLNGRLRHRLRRQTDQNDRNFRMGFFPASANFFLPPVPVGRSIAAYFVRWHSECTRPPTGLVFRVAPPLLPCQFYNLRCGRTGARRRSSETCASGVLRPAGFVQLFFSRGAPQGSRSSPPPFGFCGTQIHQIFHVCRCKYAGLHYGKDEVVTPRRRRFDG